MAINLIPTFTPARLPNGGISPDDIARRDAIAKALIEGSKPKPIEHPLQGIAQMSDAFFGGMVDEKVRKDEAENRRVIADALGGTFEGDMSPEKLNTILALDPEMGMQLLAQKREEDQRAAEWARQDAQRSEERGWTVSDRQDERDYNAPVRDAQLTGAGLQNDTGALQLDQLRTGTKQLVTPEDRAAAGIPADDTGLYQIGANGVLEPVNGGGAGGITINTGEGSDGALDKKLSEKEGESWAGFKDAAVVSGSNGQDFAVLDELMTVAPQGPITGRLAELFPGVNSAGDAFLSIVKRIAPTLRAPGSGATSDIEYEGMLQSLPSLKNYPQANKMILSIMKAKTDVNVHRGEVITAYQNGEIDIGEARRQMNELNRMSILTPEMKEALIGIGASGDVGSTSSGLKWSVE